MTERCFDPCKMRSWEDLRAKFDLDDNKKIYWRLNYIGDHTILRPASTNRVRAYVTYSKSQILQVAVLDDFLTSTFTNTTFQFPEYVK